MAKPSEIIFNLGSSHVSASKLNLKSGKLLLEKFNLIELPVASGDEQEWLNSVEGAVSELSSKFGFKGDASIILPGSMVLSKTLRVPKVEIQKQRKVVEFELSQKMPFPLETLLWDFLVIDDDGIEQEILSFAIKPDAIEKLIDIIFKCGLVPLRFTPGPALDYFTEQDSLAVEKTDSLFINFGAKSTNLTFISSTGFLLRSLGLGGVHLTDSIASTLGIKHTKAEELKKNYKNENNESGGADNTLSTLQAAQENFLNKYMQEISRSIVTYKRLKKGKTPSQLIVTGRTINSQNLLQSLSQSQMLPIKYFDPFSLINISAEIDDSSRTLLPFVSSETIGLAKILCGEKAVLPINLMPAAKVKQLANKKKLPWLFCSVLILSVIPLPWYLTLKVSGGHLGSATKSIRQQTLEEKKSLEILKKENENLEIIKAINKRASSYIHRLEMLAQRGFSLQKFLNDLQLKIDPRINQNTWIDTLELLSNNSQTTSLKSSENPPSRTMVIARISGRYLVQPANQLNSLPEDSRKLILIEESGQIQENLTRAIADIQQVVRVRKKTFSIEGKGDLYNRQFTHFEFDLELDLLR